MARRRVAGLAYHADLLAREDLVALAERARLGQVHVGVVGAVDAVDHDVVAGGGLVARIDDGASLRGVELGAAGRHDVLSLMGVARAGRAEAIAAAAVA